MHLQVCPGTESQKLVGVALRREMNRREKLIRRVRFSNRCASRGGLERLVFAAIKCWDCERS